jgi:hypothetical protein
MIMVLPDSEICHEILKIREEVNQSNLVNENNKKCIKMMRCTFQNRFDIGAMRSTIVEKIRRFSDEKDLELATKSGFDFCALKDDDWIVFTLNPAIYPQMEWFDKILAQKYESEAKVAAYFVRDLLEKLGYNYEDIYMEYPFSMPRGSKKDRPKHADFVIFNGSGRDKRNILLIIEAKIKIITPEDIDEAKSYAMWLLPAYYVITNGEKIIVFSRVEDFNVLEINILELKEKWKTLYRCISKEATIGRKLEIQNQFPKQIIG